MAVLGNPSTVSRINKSDYEYIECMDYFGLGLLRLIWGKNDSEDYMHLVQSKLYPNISVSPYNQMSRSDTLIQYTKTMFWSHFIFILTKPIY